MFPLTSRPAPNFMTLVLSSYSISYTAVAFARDNNLHPEIPTGPAVPSIVSTMTGGEAMIVLIMVGVVMLLSGNRIIIDYLVPLVALGLSALQLGYTAGWHWVRITFFLTPFLMVVVWLLDRWVSRLWIRLLIVFAIVMIGGAALLPGYAG